MRGPVSLLLLIAYFTNALQFTIPPTLGQCSPVAFSWANGTQPPNGADLIVTVLPFNSVPFNLTLPASAWTAADSGVFSTAFPFNSGTSFILFAGDSTSDIATVGDSTNSSCLEAVTPSRYAFQNTPTNCDPALLNISYSSTSPTDVPQLLGFTLGGGAPFIISPIGAPSTSYFVSVEQETQIVVQFVSPEGDYGTSSLLTIGGPLSSESCFSSLTHNSTTVISGLPQSTTNKSGKLIGIIAGCIVVSTISLWLVVYCRQRWRDRRIRLDRGIRGGPQAGIKDSEWTFATAPSLRPLSLTAVAPPPVSEADPSSRSFPYGVSAVSSSSNWINQPPPAPSLTPPDSLNAPQRPPLRRSLSRRRSGRRVGNNSSSRSKVSGENPELENSFEPSLLPDFQGSPSQKSFASSARKQDRESGRIHYAHNYF